MKNINKSTKDENIATELKLYGRLINAQNKLYEFFVEKLKLSRKDALKRVFNWSEKHYKENIGILKTEEKMMKKMNRLCEKIK